MEVPTSNKNNCSFIANGFSFISQPVFHCLVCSDSERSFVVCSSCVVVCHRGHKVVPAEPEVQEAFCDCGAGDVGKCVFKDEIDKAWKDNKHIKFEIEVDDSDDNLEFDINASSYDQFRENFKKEMDLTENFVIVVTADLKKEEEDIDSFVLNKKVFDSLGKYSYFLAMVEIYQGIQTQEKKQESETNAQTISSTVLDDVRYFGTYSRLSVQQAMLQDSIRTNAYKNAIFNNSEDFRGKVVLDVGCGTGILSMFAVQAGASKVYAIDASDMADLAKAVVVANKLEKKIIVIKGKIEQVHIPEKVDVIVSEWMGIFLLYEGMLGSVIHARNKWLKPNGKMYPSSCNLYLGLFADVEYFRQNVDYWNDVYGVNMSGLVPHAWKTLFDGMIPGIVKSECLLSDSCLFKKIDCYTVVESDLEKFISPFSLTFSRSGEWHGIVGWFDVTFEGSQSITNLSTSPHEPVTHWEQMRFFFGKILKVRKSQIVSGQITIQTLPNYQRNLKVTLDWETDGTTSTKDFDY